MFIIDWWNSLSTVAQVFYCMAIPSTLILVIQTILMFIGFDGDGDDVGGVVEDVGDSVPDEIPDASDISEGVFGEDAVTEAHDASGFEGLRIFTLRGIIAFFVVFGWVGVVMEGAGAALYVSLPIAFVCGFAMMLLMAFLFRALMKLRSDGNADNRNAVGCSGKVYLTIPASRSGEGKVSVMLQGAYVERNAVTDDETPIPTGAEIVVVGVSGQTDLVVIRK